MCLFPHLDGVEDPFCKESAHIAAAATEVDSIKLNNGDSTDQRIPPAKYPGHV